MGGEASEKKSAGRGGRGGGWFAVVFIAVLAVGAVALVVRLTVQDRFLPTGVLFYATPWPVLAAAAALGAVWMALRKRTVGVVVFGAIVVGLAGAWFLRSHRFGQAEEAPPDTVRVLFWNTARLWAGPGPVLSHIAEHDADVVLLVEAPVEDKGCGRKFAEQFPDYDVRPLNDGMLVMSRLPILALEYREPTNNADLQVVEVLVSGGGRLHLAVVDLHSNPFYNRGESIRETFAAVEELAPEACVVVGDFNTPLDSAHFKPVRKRWRHAFLEAGSGWSETWPGALPVLSLDHVWLNGQARAVSCRHATSWCSDHQSVLTEVVRERP
jgi:endonuclease/exonuclease/phosphatase (EEP) superfamily protein YafD